MSVSSDISSLFRLFGGKPEQYQDMAGDTAVVSPSPNQSTISSGPASSRATLDVAPLGKVLPPPSSQDPYAPASLSPEAWSSAQLQRLLAETSQQSCVSPLTDLSAPDLSHIRVVAVVSGKGGVGKSTITANLATALAREGHSVLAVDLDPQNALRQHFVDAHGRHIPDELGLTAPVQDPSQWMRSGADVVVIPYGQPDEGKRRQFEAQLDRNSQWLARFLAELNLMPGAIVVIDTPPGPTVYLHQALTVANAAVVLTLADAASYTALPMISRLLASYTEGRADFAGAHYVINQIDQAKSLTRDITQIMKGLLNKQVLCTVHADAAVGEALAYNRDVMDYAPNSRASHDIRQCAKALGEVLKLGEFREFHAR